MSFVNEEDLATVILKSEGEDVEIVDHSVDDFSKKRNGIMGNHYILTVSVRQKSTDTVRSVNFFVKTPPDSTEARDALVDESVSLEEVHFFARIYPVMMQDYPPTAQQWSPKCYLAKPKILVFEDLRTRGYAIRQSGIYDSDSLRAVLATLARFHASTILAEARIGKPMNLAYPDLFREKVFTDVGKGGRGNRLGFETMRLMAGRFGLDGALAEKILQLCCDAVEPVDGGCNVACHGDLWRSNITFDDASSATSCILVDYQMLRYCSPSVDIAMLVYAHTLPDCREPEEVDRLLEHYCHEFRAVLQASDCNRNEVLDRKRFLQDYERSKIVGMAYAAMRWPPVIFKEVINDMAQLEKWYFHNRIDIYSKAMNEDKDYETRVRNWVVELFDQAQRVLSLG